MAMQCNQANYIRFLVHFVTAGPTINLNSIVNVTLMPVLCIIESHLIEVHDPVLCIYLIEE